MAEQVASICKTLFLYLALGVILGELRLERESSVSKVSACLVNMRTLVQSLAHP